MPLKFFLAVWHRIRRSWRLVTISFVVAASSAFILMSFVGRHSPTRVNSNGAPPGHKIGSEDRFNAAPPYISNNAAGIVSKPNRVSTLAKPIRATDEERRIMAEKLATDTQNLERVQSELKHVSLQRREEPATGPEEKSAQSFADNHRTRRELASELILLLMLEKRNKGDSYEIIAVRRKITRLQLELSQTDANAPRSSPVDVIETKASAKKLRSQITSCKKDVLADQQQLTSASASVENSPSEESENSPTVERPGTASSPINASFISTETPNESLGYTTAWHIFASAIIGSTFSLLIVMMSPASSRTIKDEATLLKVITKQSAFLGSIPRMKH